jgi:hypothetical protein
LEEGAILVIEELFAAEASEEDLRSYVPEADAQTLWLDDLFGRRDRRETVTEA